MAKGDDPARELLEAQAQANIRAANTRADLHEAATQLLRVLIDVAVDARTALARYNKDQMFRR